MHSNANCDKKSNRADGELNRSTTGSPRSEIGGKLTLLTSSVDALLTCQQWTKVGTTRHKQYNESSGAYSLKNSLGNELGERINVTLGITLLTRFVALSK